MIEHELDTSHLDDLPLLRIISELYEDGVITTQEHMNLFESCLD